MRRSLALVLFALVLAGCGGSDDDSDSGDVGGTGGQGEPNSDAASIAETGFGQQGQYATGIAVVQAEDDSAVDRFITVSMNFLDAAGDVIATETQTESFSWADQRLIIPVFNSDVGGKEVSSVEATLAFGSSNAGTGEPLDDLTTEEIEQSQNGERTTASFLLTNPGAEQLGDLRVGVLCRDEAGAIIGGGAEYPELVPAAGEIRLEADPMVSGLPVECEASVNYGY